MRSKSATKTFNNINKNKSDASASSKHTVSTNAQKTAKTLQNEREIRHQLMDGKVQLYQRTGSPNWQCACSINGRQQRANTREDSLSRAAVFAREWYLALISADRPAPNVRSDKASKPAKPTSAPRAIAVSGPPVRTFREAARRFMIEFEAITQGQRNAIYVHGHRRRLANHLVPFFGATAVDDIGAGMIADYRIHRMSNGRRGKPPARSTMHQEIVCLRQVLKTAIRHKWLDHLPDLSAPYGRSGKVSHRAWFSPEEWRTFDAALRERARNPLKEQWRTATENLRDCVLFMVNTGLRPDEALRLEYRDVAIVVDEATGERLLEIAVRGKRGVGWCKSMPEAVAPFRRLKSRNAGAPLDRLFPSLQNELFNTVLDELNMKVDREGQRRTAYSLRHTYISTRLMNGADIYQVAKNCRTSVEMIETYYASHIKNVIDASAINVRKTPPSRQKASAPPV